MDAFRRGLPRPERSVRTSPWLARIALTTLEDGRAWQRVRIVDEPLSDYTRYELAGYVESQAAGEEIRIAPRAAAAPLAVLERDFWLFDAWEPSVHALLMVYGSGGQWLDAVPVTDWGLLREFESEYSLALSWSIPLNEYTAKKAQKAA